MLEAHGLASGYDRITVIEDIGLRIGDGEWVALVGAVGAGKSTLMRTLAGSLEAKAGRIVLNGADVTALPSYRRVTRGLSLVPEGRRLFPGMTTAENLLAGAYTAKRSEVAARLAHVHGLFPILAERHGQQVGTLSGGEQQMCAIGRALMSRPNVLLVDELSLGLAPVVVDALLDALAAIRDEGTALLVVEQDVETSLSRADRGYVMRHGSIVTEGPSAALLADPALTSEFLGIGA
jgi:branched-chain amino acid transport system ATP-binding protein